MTDDPRLFVGIDFGTSGCRLCAIDVDGRVVRQVQRPLPAAKRDGSAVEQDPLCWWQGLEDLFASLPSADHARIVSVAVDGTSGTLVACDPRGRPLAPALMYNDARAAAQARRIARLAPSNSGAHGASASLAKLLWLHDTLHLPDDTRALHQADWLADRLTGGAGTSDENNALKLGYDPFARGWPEWLEATGLPPGLFPDVLPPGTPIAAIAGDAAHRLQIPPTARIVTGTTDSIAAFLATGADRIGDAATSLGSTLALKVLSPVPVFDPDAGVYSHRLWDRWLAGGASNTGGAVLRQFFGAEQLRAMTPRLDPDRPTGLDYYPLPRAGERFPVSDPTLEPRLAPRPDDDVRFFQGLLEGIAAIEARGYRKLEALGAPYPQRVFSVGGGAANPGFTRIRARALRTEMATPVETEAAYGAALLARRGIMVAANQPRED